MSRFQLTVLAGLHWVLASAALAQQQMPETKSGTLKEIATKNRGVILTITDGEGQEHVIPVTPKLRFEVRGTGDEGFVSAGQYIEGSGVVTNDKLFVNAVTVYVLGPGKKAPAGQIAKTPKEAGSSKNGYHFGGTVISRMPDPEFPDYQRLATKIGGRVPPIMLEKDFGVEVVLSTADQAQPGMPVEFDVLTGRGGQPIYARVSVRPVEPFKSEELLKPADKR